MMFDFSNTRIFLRPGATNFRIAQKILEKGQWPWPDTAEEAREIKIAEVKMLLKGIDFFCAYEPMMFESID